MQRLFKLHWNALAIVIYIYTAVSLTPSRTALMHWCRQLHTHTYKHPHYSPRTNACTDGANKKCMHVHICVCMCILTYIHTLCMSLPHPCMLPRTHTHIYYGPTFEFGFVSVRSRRRLRLAGLFARFGYPHPAAIMSRQHHHRFISFTRT